MQEDFIALLLADAALSALVGDRVHWLVQPDDVAAWPYVNLQIVSGDWDYHVEGDSGLHVTRVQIDAWAQSYSEAVSVIRALVDLLSGYRGGIIQGVFINTMFETVEREPGEADKLFRGMLDVSVTWG